jgi:hypothetical protein
MQSLMVDMQSLAVGALKALDAAAEHDRRAEQLPPDVGFDDGG